MLKTIKVKGETYNQLLAELRVRETMDHLLTRLMEELFTARKRRVRKSAPREEVKQ